MKTVEFHEGGCQCGAVRYRTVGEPAKTAICHCRYCQTRTGSAFGLSVYFAKAQLTVLQGEMRDYHFETESGRGFTNQFCVTCGTTLFWHLEMTPELVGVAGGTFDPPTFWFEVKREIFTRSAAPFVHTDLTDRFETTASYRPVKIDGAALQGAKRG